ncbi:MAG: tetratricopeptide repeat protein [Candidatus Competibacterales bacterium]|nr:tetratricopeptide repeat protein [Candidatus Competibacterales bacterium]
MTEPQYRFLKITALAMALAWVGWSVYDFLRAKQPGDYAYHAASNYFADGYYEQALEEYRKALAIAPDHRAAQRGLAETLILLGQERESIALYDTLIGDDPDNPGLYANRGIAHDRLGQHEQALADYRKALSIDPEQIEGPGWLTRFFRNQYEKPPGIAQRADYLEHQLALPPDERVLRVPEIDRAQRPFKG